ncbi:hypothetical protein SDC9_212921 [bioreactor metagenome]|uniref:Uncharacterized protein n=1 Tax=bioreactor metagenome TaxID=1076179 RepID=A0A645JPB3_9ZZZZ
MTKTELSIGEHHFPLKSISSIGLIGVYKMMFSVDGTSYELRTAKNVYCGRKYFTLFEYLKRQN